MPNETIDDSLMTASNFCLFIIFTHFMTHDPTYEPFCLFPSCLYLTAFGSSLLRKLLACSHRASHEHGFPWTPGPLHSIGTVSIAWSSPVGLSFGAMGRGLGVNISFLTT